MNLGVEPAATTLLNQYNPQLPSKYASLYPHVGVVWISIKETCLCNRQKLVESTIINKIAQLWGSVPKYISTTQLDIQDSENIVIEL